VRFVFALVALCGLARAEIKTRVVDYQQAGTQLQGMIAWDDTLKDKRPGVVVIHEWWGHNEHARDQAKRLAKAGYVGFALDLFGKGKLAAHPKDAQAFVAEATRDPKVTQARFQAAVEVLQKDPHVDAKLIGAVGYCFGGTVALEMARMGADLKAVSTFHASLGLKTPAEKGKIKPRILVNTGAADPMIPTEAVETFKKDMTAAGATYDVISYPNAKHSFTNHAADKAGMPALAYDSDADQKSWDATLKMFKQAFGK
jgi:dienelactone hydrolase